jgi:hypothetical protein
LESDFRYQSYVASRVITVPARFITDFTSVPEPLRIMFPVWQRYGPGAIVHDYLYWQNNDKQEADNVLREAMTVLGVGVDNIVKIYEGVHIFGQPAWEKNAQLKAVGYTRMAGAGSNAPYAALPD